MCSSCSQIENCTTLNEITCCWYAACPGWGGVHGGHFGRMLVPFLWSVVAFFILVGRFTVVTHTGKTCCMRYMGTSLIRNYPPIGPHILIYVSVLRRTCSAGCTLARSPTRRTCTSRFTPAPSPSFSLYLSPFLARTHTRALSLSLSLSVRGW